ncbi:MAG: class I SAM-dependent methyltransferase [Phycisphaerales bacterium]
MDRHDFYEICVQSAEDSVPLLEAVHGERPRRLGEDFAGTAAVARAWVQRVDDGSAIAVDRDAEALRRGEALASAAGISGDVQFVTADVRELPDDVAGSVDVVYVGNFSICELHLRTELVTYLRAARARLRPGGVFVCDLYGGVGCHEIGTAERTEPGPKGTSILYTWEQREADPLTGRVVNALHFEHFAADGETLAEFSNAFTYDWRLWSVPELRDALQDAGFSATEVHGRQPDAMDGEGNAFVRAFDDPDDLDEEYDVLVVGRTND